MTDLVSDNKSGDKLCEDCSNLKKRVQELEEFKKQFWIEITKLKYTDSLSASEKSLDEAWNKFK